MLSGVWVSTGDCVSDGCKPFEGQNCQRWVPWELPPTYRSTTFPTRAAVPVPITAFSYFHCFFASYCNISGTSDKTVREDLQCFQVFGFQPVEISRKMNALILQKDKLVKQDFCFKLISISDFTNFTMPLNVELKTAIKVFQECDQIEEN